MYTMQRWENRKLQREAAHDTYLILCPSPLKFKNSLAYKQSNKTKVLVVLFIEEIDNGS